MPYQMLCNGTWQKSPEARSGLGSAPSHCTSLHKNRYGIETELHLITFKPDRFLDMRTL